MDEKLFPSRLKELRIESGITLEELGRKVGTTKTTLSRYENGERSPKIQLVGELADFFNVDMAWLSGLTDSKKNFQIDEVYNKLEPFRQRKVYDFAEAQLKEQRQETDKKTKIVQFSASKSTDQYDEDNKNVDIDLQVELSAGAGFSNYDKVQVIDTVTVRRKDIPAYYDLAGRINGDSMRPVFKDQEIIFLEKTHEVYNGMIAALEINEEAFLKKIYMEDGRMKIVSLNEDLDENGKRIYPDFYADEHDEIYIIGKVIM